MDDSQIIDLFFARSELAISELDAKYGKVCHKLAHNILDSRQRCVPGHVVRHSAAAA